MESSASEPASCPVAGCRLPVDIFLQSSDGILTGAHTRNLETFGEAFPASSVAAPPSEPIVLAEFADVLQLLMHFMHLVPQPSLEGRPIEFVLRCAEAVDKYGVHAAGQLCWLKMWYVGTRMLLAMCASPDGVVSWTAITSRKTRSRCSSTPRVSICAICWMSSRRIRSSKRSAPSRARLEIVICSFAGQCIAITGPLYYMTASNRHRRTRRRYQVNHAFISTPRTIGASTLAVCLVGFTL
ncbi:hypothetical protein BD626DRAFT_514082 [Schizophyllum amplum]|uniref:BTB domain-containing protein n=1 Tax=Schizophyllum amplum TaxID=97359 RepID=A0A550BYL5_9AGAR|nr:hypothetical protein BD626DRAFT_514082 [Auriculariopsis ampla]